MNKTKVNLVFYGDYGMRRGKGMEVMATAEALLREGILNKVYVRDKGFAEGEIFKHLIISIPFGNFIPRILSGVKKFIIPSFQSRIWGEIIFDFFTSIRLKKDADILYVSAGSIMTIKKAKKLGYIIGQHCGTLHPKHNLELTKKEFRDFNTKFRGKSFFSNLERMNRRMKLYNFFGVHSKFTKDNYIENGLNPSDIFINPLGIDLEEFKPFLEYSKKRKKTFIFIGSVTLLKGVHYLLEAWKELNLKDANLIIGGVKEADDWEYLKKYENINNVDFIGFIDPKEYYTKGTVFVFPTLTESFPRVVSEAMASGLPVITTPPASEMLREGENGFIVPIRDIKAIKNKILFFYNNPDKAIEMGKKAREVAEEYTWRKYEERFINIIKKVSEEN